MKKTFFFLLLNFNKGSLFSLDTILVLDSNYEKAQFKTYTIKKKNNKAELKEYIEEIKNYLSKQVREFNKLERIE